MPNPQNVSDKSFLTTFLLSLFLGMLGIDRFYLVKKRSGAIKLITLGGAGVWYVFDLIYLLTGRTVDGRGLLVIDGRKKWLKASIALAIIILIIGGIVGAINYKEPKSVEPYDFSSLFNKKERTTETPAKEADSQQKEASSQATETNEKVSLSKHEAELYYQDAALLGQYIDLKKTSIISLWNYDVQYTDDQSTVSQDGYPIKNLSWTGKNEDIDENIRFNCWVSGPKENTVLHWLSIDGATLYGSSGF